MFHNIPQLGEKINKDGFIGTVTALSLTKQVTTQGEEHTVTVTLKSVNPTPGLGHTDETFIISVPIAERRPDNEEYKQVVKVLSAIQHDKEGTYGSSWKGKGEYRGIMANIDRKYDRLDKMTDDEVARHILSLPEIESHLKEFGKLPEGVNPESKVDAIADLANYTILYMSYIKANFPEVYKYWARQNLPEHLQGHYFPLSSPKL
ncbi:hypothetical protein EalM132_00121 [Exiguobacterium phage vB_EalM-132]|nr:hypothetical protein EalM132_00121 [Exiguobacterium phage vB_EalM-132]